MPVLARPLRIDQREDQRNCFLQDFGRNRTDSLRFPLAPVEALDLVRENGPLRRKTGWKDHFERIAFHLCSDRAEQRKADSGIVRSRRDHQRRTMAGLLVPGLRIELEPDNVSTVGNILAGHYQASRPTGFPVTTSSCRFREVTFRSSSDKAY